MQKELQEKSTGCLIVLLGAHFLGGALGALLGVAVARLWLTHQPIEQ